MKKILILSFGLLLAIFTNAFSQTYTESEEYKEGVEYYEEATEEHGKGEYNSSYDLAMLAQKKLDSILLSVSTELFNGYKSNADAAKADADVAIARAKSVGAPTTTAEAAYNEAASSHTLIGTFEDDTADAQAKIDAANKIMADLPSSVQNNLDMAKKKHENLIASSIITKGDDTDSQVSTLLADAESLIASGDDSAAQTKIDSANKLMAEASGKSGLSAARDEYYDAKDKQEALLSSGIIAKGDDTDNQISALLADAEKFLSEVNTAEQQESENYKNTIDGYAQAEKLASDSYDAYIKDKTSETQKLISDATTKYNTLLKSGVIQKGDATDNAVSAAIAKANEDLKNNNFDAAKSGINAIMNTMTQAENDNASKKAQAQSALDASKKKQEDLLASGVLKKNDDYDKKITAVHNAANTAISKNDFAAATASITEASKLMAEAEASNKAVTTAAQSDLDAAKKKYQELLNSGAITKGSDTDKQISDLLAEAEKLLAAGDTAGAQAKIDAANKLMADAEASNKSALTSTQSELDAAKKKYEDLLASGAITKGSDTDKQISDLLAEAEKLLAAGDTAGAQAKIDAANKLMDILASDNELHAVTASILDQLRKIRDMVRELVEGGKIDVNGSEVARINAIINRMIDLLSTGELNAENLEQAKDHLNELVETVEQVVSEVNAVENANANNGSSGRRVVNTLPKYYVVRNADSLWVIARYDFVYGSSMHWEVLYNANINLFVDRDNPHVILPGQVIEIPSLDGENREGVYSPDVEYIINE